MAQDNKNQAPEAPTTTQLMIQVFNRLKIEMNGAVTGGMESFGLKYALNYGVSSITIKNIAKEFAPNHELAIALWRQEIRETRLAAIYIEDPLQLTYQQMQKWIDESKTYEIAQYCAMELFWKSPLAVDVCQLWLHEFEGFDYSIDPQDQLAMDYITKTSLRFGTAFYTLGRMINNGLLGESETSEIFKNYSPQIAAAYSSNSCTTYTVKALDYFLSETFKKFASLRKNIEQIATQELKELLAYL